MVPTRSLSLLGMKGPLMTLSPAHVEALKRPVRAADLERVPRRGFQSGKYLVQLLVVRPAEGKPYWLVRAWYPKPLTPNRRGWDQVLEGIQRKLLRLVDRLVDPVGSGPKAYDRDLTGKSLTVWKDLTEEEALVAEDPRRLVPVG